jgi:hypothetical protein
MKRFLASFILFYWESYIREDWSVITKLGKIYYYPFWFIRAILLWLICPIAIPEYFFKKSKLYTELQKRIKQLQYEKN